MLSTVYWPVGNDGNYLQQAYLVCLSFFFAPAVIGLSVVQLKYDAGTMEPMF
jgi:hypothetical protein